MCREHFQTITLLHKISRMKYTIDILSATEFEFTAQKIRLPKSWQRTPIFQSLVVFLFVLLCFTTDSVAEGWLLFQNCIQMGPVV